MNKAIIDIGIHSPLPIHDRSTIPDTPASPDPISISGSPDSGPATPVLEASPPPVDEETPFNKFKPARYPDDKIYINVIIFYVLYI